ncbi:ABC transporter permease [Paenibacillus aquistagni]|uniref:ABC-2 family transporter protein n=1 Tax=Paenibacillus aquistagni TaxID=1852522 RepID=A0A1X7ITM8_9BACL|nr:ABC transporter permease [Paenibacillus aquistagni]NMM51085.1 ABC transporter permease subunit [Paenibacillus aquistagni]SMG18224.1 ABC-2 family transporter protein [Paenibacillus aquistagni]
MLKLMRLELQRNKLTTYFTASAIACVCLIGFIYFVAYVAQVENEIDFQNYSNIFLFTSVVSMIVYAIMAAVMYSRFVIDEYRGKMMLLLFSYPISRKKMLLAKMLLIMSFTTLAMIVSNIPPLIIFSISETISPIVSDTLSTGLILNVVKTIFILGVSLNTICLVALRIGFAKKSVPATIVLSFVLCALYGNAIIASFGNDAVILALCLLMLIIGGAIVLELLNKVHRMEFEEQT